MTSGSRTKSRRCWVGSREDHEPVGAGHHRVPLIAYGALSGRLQSTPVTQAMVFVALGLLVGNRTLDLIDVDAANQLVRHLAEATLMVLFTDAVRVNLGTLRRESALPARLLGVGLPLTIVAGTWPAWPCSRS